MHCLRAILVCTAAAAVAPVSRRSLLKTTGAAAVATPLAANAADKPLLAAGTIAVPRVGFGLYKTAPEETKAAVALALEAGVRHFDTANAYNNEAELGAALREGDTGENVFVATKISPTAGASARDAVAAAADRPGLHAHPRPHHRRVRQRHREPVLWPKGVQG